MRILVACYLIAAFFAVVTASFADDAAAAQSQELERLSGTWKVVYMNKAGTIGTAKQIEGMRWWFAGPRLRIGLSSPQAGDSIALVSVDPKKKPQHIDLKYAFDTNDPFVMPCIYKREGDRFKIQVDKPHSQTQAVSQLTRPTKFTPKADTTLFYVELERVDE